ncbi:MAG: hypothetical protein ACE14S_02235 [Candidatus Bathyarchaeia archaeon]
MLRTEKGKGTIPQRAKIVALISIQGRLQVDSIPLRNAGPTAPRKLKFAKKPELQLGVRLELVRITREDYYFQEPGEQNTNDVVEAVKKRVCSTGIRYVVVASNSGSTALKLAQALGEQAVVICVTGAPYRREWSMKWPTLQDEARKKLEDLGVVVVDKAPYAFHNSVMESGMWSCFDAEQIIRETLYAFGQGLKVAVEVVLMAVETGNLDPYQDVIGVGGTGRGADSAAVIRATYPATIFSKDLKKKLEIREIIAMPLKKHAAKT